MPPETIPLMKFAVPYTEIHPVNPAQLNVTSCKLIPYVPLTVTGSSELNITWSLSSPFADSNQPTVSVW